MARFSPICRGSRCTPPASAARPTRGSGSAKVAFSDGDDEVAGQRDLETAAHRDAVDGGDDRLVAVEARGEAGEAALVPAALSARGLPLQIVAGAECLVAGAGDDRHPLLGIGGEIVEHLVELEMRVDVQRVVHLGARQRDDRDRALARYLDEFQIHVRSRCDFLWRRILTAILARGRCPGPRNYARHPRVPSPIALLDLGGVFSPYPIRTGALAAPKRKSQ